MGLKLARYRIVLGVALVLVAPAVALLIVAVVERLLGAAAKQAMPSLPLAEDAEREAAQEEARVAAVIAAALASVDEESQAEGPPRLPDSVLNLERVSQGWKAAGRIAGTRRQGGISSQNKQRAQRL